MRDAPNAQHFHYLLWEDWRNGLYGSAYRESVIALAFDVLQSPNVFAETLQTVGVEWPVSTAQNLSDVYRNHQPWCGRAAACFKHGATISEVNEAWKHLSPDEKLAANRVADGFTYSWRSINMLGQMRWPI